jgi:hypothetical protein
LKINHVIALAPVHWRADCCPAMRYKHSSYCCVKVFVASLPSYIRYILYSVVTNVPEIQPAPNILAKGFCVVIGVYKCINSEGALKDLRARVSL